MICGARLRSPAMRTLDGIGDVAGKVVLVRADLNVPLDEDGGVADDTRIAALVPTLAALREAEAYTVVLAHLGRPGGARDPAMTLGYVAQRLSVLLGSIAAFAADTTGPLANGALMNLAKGEALVLENVRFEPGETTCDPALAERLAARADLFVDDAFGCAHRAHASNVGIGRILPPAAGLLMEREVRALDALRDEIADGGAVVAVGGIKTADKLDALEALADTADAILIGGALAATFIATQGGAVGRSICEGAEGRVRALRVLDRAERSGCEILLPTDVVATDGLTVDAQIRVEPADAVPDDCIALDIGPETAARYAERLRSASYAIWDGPMGAYEMEPFAAGTAAVAEALARAEGTSVVGGGDAVAAAHRFGHAGAFGYVSTGGTAMLELLGGRELPAVVALDDA